MPTPYCAFAHMVLPAFASAYPAEFFALMPTDGRAQVLDLLWRETESRAGPFPVDLDTTSINVTCGAIDGIPAVLIEMPKPVALAETFYVALISLNGLPSREAPADADLRYVTLELGRNLDGSARTVLCEWRHGIHFNYGDGPEPAPAAFCSAVRELLRNPPPPPPAPPQADA